MFIVLPKAQATLVRRALARLEGLPRRATVMRDGVPDADLTAKLGASLATIDVVDMGDDDGTTVSFELPVAFERFLGRTVTISGTPVTLPTREQLVADESALLDTIKAVRAAKRAPLVPVAP